MVLALKKQLPQHIGYGDGNSVTVINAFVNLVNCFKIFNLIILFICLQNVRELGFSF